MNTCSKEKLHWRSLPIAPTALTVCFYEDFLEKLWIFLTSNKKCFPQYRMKSSFTKKWKLHYYRKNKLFMFWKRSAVTWSRRNIFLVKKMVSYDTKRTTEFIQLWNMIIYIKPSILNKYLLQYHTNSFFNKWRHHF